MRKRVLILAMVTCMLVFIACSSQGKNYDKSVDNKDTITYSFSGTENDERLQKFIDNVDEGKTDRINLVRYTTEGDPIITQLYFNGEDIEIALDNSKDKFGGRDKYRVVHDTIKGGEQLKDNLIKYLKDNSF